MKYTIIINTISGEHDIMTIIDSNSPAQAHNHAAQLALDSEAEVERVHVFPCTTDAYGNMDENGLARGALMIARRTARNSVKRTGGNETQWRIDKELTAANARCIGAESADYIQSIICEYSADTQDFYGYAMRGLIDGHGHAIAEQYRMGYAALNRFIHSQRAATVYELSTEFIVDGGGDIVSIGAAVASILRGTDKYTPTASARLDSASARKLCVTLAAAVNQLTPTQKDIVRMMGNGYSQRQIADRMGRKVATIAEHAAIIRKRITAYMMEHAPEFIDNKRAQTSVQADAVNAAATANKSKSAEYYRAYRARKAAERKATETANG